MFVLPELPYAYDSLAPALSAETLHLHHDKHHAGYVKALNALLLDHPSSAGDLEQIIGDAQGAGPAALFNNAAQCWNHSFYWLSMSNETRWPTSELTLAIDANFGDLESLKALFVAEGVAHFGSGWVWLTADHRGVLKVATTHDAHGMAAEPGVTPLMVCDLWEHAYYLDHHNDRRAYLDAWLDKLPNWAFASSQFAAALSGDDPWRHPASTPLKAMV